MDQQIVIALISFGAGIFVAIIGFVARYFFDYRIAKRKLHNPEHVAQ